MSAIVIRSAPREVGASPNPADYMPFSVRHRAAGELNRLWEEFVNDMHSGPTSGHEVADKFWKFVTTRGR